MSVVLGRSDVPGASRLVVKVGSSSLTTPQGHLDRARLAALADVIAARALAGQQVVLVSSGAQAAAMGPLGFTRKPVDLEDAQAAASVGQGLLMAHYTRAFGAHGLRVGQILLTAEDVIRRSHYRNARRALNRLFDLGVVPIVNENDAVATDELRFGDNDRLAAMVAHLVHADALVLLTDVDALYTAPPGRPGSRRVDLVTSFDQIEALHVTGRGSGVGTGGMTTKVQAAAIATSAGIPVLLTSAAQAAQALEGREVGTWFAATGKRVPARQLWIAYAARIKGQVTVDDGAVVALTQRHKSLLPAGVVGATGDFGPGDAVEIVDGSGQVIGRGLAGYSTPDVIKIMGHTTAELVERWGTKYGQEVVHRDELVLMARHRRL